MQIIVRLQSARIAALLGAILLASHATADQVIADDLIVQGSACVGLDCVNNESFGFATIRLKENNTRIEFDDTSTGTGFPANDWQITANDPGSGGANYLAFDDLTGVTQPFRVTAGAPTASVFVDSSGNVGLGTAAPILRLHLAKSDTPGVRLEQNGSGGFTPQTWDVAGNEANFFVRDVTGGSRLPFRIRPGAPTSSIDIAASGFVGVGTASPITKLHLSDKTSPAVAVIASFENFVRRWSAGVNPAGNFRISDNTTGADRVTIDATGEVGIGTVPAAQLHTTGTVRFAGVANCASGIKSDASGNLSCIVSSARFKDIVGALSPDMAVANVMALRPQVGTYKETPDVPEHWLIAEDVAAVDPALAGFRDGQPYTVKTQNVVADLVAVIQEQQRRIEALERTVASR